MVADVKHARLGFALRFNLDRKGATYLAMPVANGVRPAWRKRGAVKRGFDEADKDAQT